MLYSLNRNAEYAGSQLHQAYRQVNVCQLTRREKYHVLPTSQSLRTSKKGNDDLKCTVSPTSWLFREAA